MPRMHARDLWPLLRRLAPGAVWALGACYQLPPGTNSASYTSVPVAYESGASQSTASNGNAASPNSTPAHSAVAVGSMTITPKSNPYVCLTASAVTLGAPVVLATCAGDSRQAWLLQDGHLMASQNLCLDADPNVTTLINSVPKLAVCDANVTHQVIGRSGFAGLLLVDNGIPVALTAQLPTSDASTATFQNIDANSTGQAWALAADNAATGALVQNGIAISPSTASGLCLTGDANGLGYAPCLSKASQSWRWDASGQLSNNGNCVTGVAGGPLVLMACKGDTTQRWYSLYSGLMSMAALGCITTPGSNSPGESSITLTPCLSQANPGFALGSLGAAGGSANVGAAPTGN